MTKRLTRGRLTMKNGKVTLPKRKPPVKLAPETEALLALPAEPVLLLACPELADGKTRLGQKMRELAGRCPDPEKAILLNRYAEQLDFTIYSLGRTTGFESLQAYQTARRCYEEIAGVPYVAQK